MLCFYISRNILARIVQIFQIFRVLSWRFTKRWRTKDQLQMMFKSDDDIVLQYIALKPIRNKRFLINFVSNSLLIKLMVFFCFFFTKNELASLQSFRLQNLPLLAYSIHLMFYCLILIKLETKIWMMKIDGLFTPK